MLLTTRETNADRRPILWLVSSPEVKSALTSPQSQNWGVWVAFPRHTSPSVAGGSGLCNGELAFAAAGAGGADSTRVLSRPLCCKSGQSCCVQHCAEPEGCLHCPGSFSITISLAVISCLTGTTSSVYVAGYIQHHPPCLTGGLALFWVYSVISYCCQLENL